MILVSLKEYAQNNNVSYEAVRQQVVRYADELGEHIVKDGRQQFLDEEAVAFLDKKRSKNPVSIIQINKDEHIQYLENKNKEILEELNNLLRWKADNALKIAQIEANQKLLDDTQESLKTANQSIEKLRDEGEDLRAELREVNAEHKQVVSAYEDKLRQFQEELDRPLTFMERLTGRRSTK